MYEKRIRIERAIAIGLAVAVGFLLSTVASAGTTEQSSDWPWQRRPKAYGYNERPPASPPPSQVTRTASKYTLTVTVGRAATETSKQNLGVVMASVPDSARLWFENEPTRQRGTLREYESPPLRVGKKYIYHVRLVWFEDGHWVHETKEIPVSAGEMTCLYLTKPSAMAAALDELSPEDRRAAEQQGFCAVKPETPLGAMGVPTKVMIGGQPVFLCCEDCVEKARKNAAETLAQARDLLAKSQPK